MAGGEPARCLLFCHHNDFVMCPVQKVAQVIKNSGLAVQVLEEMQIAQRNSSQGF